MARFRDNVETGHGGQFLRLKDKESQYVIFMGDPYEFFQTFDQAKMKATVVPEGTPKASFRFRINAIVKIGDKYEARIFENNANTYNKIKAVNDAYGGLDTVIVKITRNGVGLETDYSVIPLRQEIPPHTKKILDNIQLLKLEHDDAPKRESAAENYFAGDPGPMDDNEHLPF